MTDTLLSLAELAVAITGFAAIVIVFRRRDTGRWEPIGANSFNGMLFHSMTALVFCLVPVALGALRLEPAAIWRVGSGLLGVVLLLHAPIVALVFARGRSLAARATVLAGELPVAALLLAVAWGALAERAAGLFVAALCLQILQAAGLFFSITFVRRDEMED
ncbi:MAG: hypothetical protein ACHQ6V_07165 [Myxococcota bacterium]